MKARFRINLPSREGLSPSCLLAPYSSLPVCNNPRDKGRRRRAGCIRQERKRKARAQVKVATQTETELGGKIWQQNVDDFDWTRQWYPMGFKADFRENKLEKVCLFDVSYVLLIRENGEVSCLLDQCPHRLAALSEGRVTEQGFIQCAYHGWSFSGKCGKCTWIPQLQSEPAENLRERTQVDSFPAKLSQGLVWICPSKEPVTEVPPRVPERDNPAFKAQMDFVRDFPVDYSLIIENITDPDHGIFAHQAVSFDMYTASKRIQQKVTRLVEEDEIGRHLVLKGEVPAVKKVTTRGGDGGGGGGGGGGEIQGAVPKDALIGTTTFHPPTHVRIARRDKEGKTKFLIAFWVVPTGLGRCRFMSSSHAMAPFSIPRWIGAINLNKFLDQDTYLVATEQEYVLQQELACHKTGEKLDRKSIYVYQSPAERFLMELGKFLDITLPKMPNRYKDATIEAYLGSRRGVTREQVLDRYAQHTARCPDSLGFVRNCKIISLLACIYLVALVSKAVMFSVSALASDSLSLSKVLWKAGAYAFSSPVFLFQLLVVVFSLWLSRLLISEYYYKHKEEHRDRDLGKINSSNVYPDARIGATSS